MCTDAPDAGKASELPTIVSGHATLKYSLLGPSLTKAGQDTVDQAKVSEIIYNASQGSKFFNREEAKDKILTAKINRILAKKRQLAAQVTALDSHLDRTLHDADARIAALEASRDLTQHIVHVDCDAFYAAVEQLDRPELRHVPFAVGGGVLTTCNYIARKFGCRSGMAGFVAKKLCPQLQLLPLTFGKYRDKAKEVRAVLAVYDPRFESASIDEAYLNVTEYCAEHNMTPADAVAQMRAEVHNRTGITVSAGIAANAKLAKICSNMNKPNGQYLLPSDRQAIMTFMRDLPCRKVNGVGRVLERELAAVSVNTCGDIYAHRRFLEPIFGEKTATFLFGCYLGLGRTIVQPFEDHERKSIGTERTFGELSDPTQLREKLRRIADELEQDMRRVDLKGRTLVLKIKLHTYEVFTRQFVTPKAVCLADDLYAFGLNMLAKLEQEMPGMKLRLMGLRCTHLVRTTKADARTFFGLGPKRAETTDSGGRDVVDKSRRDAREEEWEMWPYDELDGEDGEVHRGEIGLHTEMHAANSGSRSSSHQPPRKGSAAEPPALVLKAEHREEYWDCPICYRPQTADGRLFNAHIDLCLSRQTIREAVHEHSRRSVSAKRIVPASETTQKRVGRGFSGGDMKRGRPPADADPRQKRLCFGS